MAQTSIIDIPVNDEAFRRFMELFSRYQQEAKKLPEGWAQTNDIVGGISAGFAAMTAEMAAQNEHLAQRAEAERKLEKAEKAAAEAKKSSDREAAAREREAAGRRQKMISDLRTMADLAVGLGKWALLGGAAGAVTGALSLWGMDRLLQSVSDERRTAQGFGVSTGQRQGLALNMQRYFDVNSALENIAGAQADPSKRWIFSGFGVNPNGKDPGQLTGEMALAARRIFMEGHGNQMWAQSHGLLDVFSMDDLRRLAATPEGELRKSATQAGLDAAPGGRAYLADKVSNKWQDFLVNLNAASLGLKNNLVDKLSALERNRAFDKLLASFTKIADSVLDRIDWDRLAGGLDHLADYVGSAKFQSDVKTLLDDFSALAGGLDNLIKKFQQWGLLPGGSASDGGVPYKPGPGVRGVESKLNLLGPLGWADNMAIDHIWGPLFTRHTRRAEAVEKFMGSQGWGTQAQAGMVANAEAESGLDPLRWQRGISHDNPGAGYGLFQWNAARRADYAKLFGHSMQSVADPAQAMREQLRFMQWELTHTYKRVGEALKHAKTQAGAGYLISEGYEKPAGGAATAAIRARAAAQVHVTIKNQTGASVATTANALN